MKVKTLHLFTDLRSVFDNYCGHPYEFRSDQEKQEFFEQESKGIEWLFGSYCYEDYSGEAFVIFKRDGKIYTNGGGHCSCNGLEGQWAPQESSIEAVMGYLNEGTLGRNSSYYQDTYENIFADELREFLEEVASEEVFTSVDEVLDGVDMNQDLHQLIGYVWAEGNQNRVFPSEHMGDLALKFLQKHSR